MKWLRQKIKNTDTIDSFISQIGETFKKHTDNLKFEIVKDKSDLLDKMEKTEATNKIHNQISNLITKKFNELDVTYKTLQHEHQQQLSRVVNKIESTMKEKLAVLTRTQYTKLDTDKEQALSVLKETIQNERSELLNQVLTLELKS